MHQEDALKLLRRKLLRDFTLDELSSQLNSQNKIVRLSKNIVKIKLLIGEQRSTQKFCGWSVFHNWGFNLEFSLQSSQCIGIPTNHNQMAERAAFKTFASGTKKNNKPPPPPPPLSLGPPATGADDVGASVAASAAPLVIANNGNKVVFYRHYLSNQFSVSNVVIGGRGTDGEPRRRRQRRLRQRQRALPSYAPASPPSSPSAHWERK